MNNTNKNVEFLKANSIKKFVKENFKMRSSQEAVEKAIEVISLNISKTLLNASNFAKENKRNTIMLEDIQKSLELNFGAQNLSEEQLFEEILKQEPTGLGKISSKIEKFISSKKDS